MDKNVLIIGTVHHAHAKYKELEVKYNLHHGAKTRKELIAQLTAAKASGLVFHAIYRGVGSQLALGRVDQELLSYFNLTKPSISSSTFSATLPSYSTFPTTTTTTTTTLEANPLQDRLGLIASSGAGFDFVDSDFATCHQILVTNTPKVVSNATADATILLLLSTLRHHYEVEYNLRHGLTEKKPWVGRDPTGLTLGIVGMGEIGKAVARRAASLGMKIVYHNRFPLFSESDQEGGEEDEEDEGTTKTLMTPRIRRDSVLALEASDPVIENAKYYTTLEGLLSVSDVVSVHVPLNKNTLHLFSDHQFGLMKPGSYFLNTSRGPVVDEEALVRALQREHLAGAGLDVFEYEPKVDPWLLKSLNVALMPHLGGLTVESITNMELLVMDNIDQYLETGKALTPVNSF